MKKVALLIGVSEYEGLSPLPSAVEDVDALYRVLVDPERGEFLAENVTVLKNPDLQQMANEIYWLFHDRHKDDLLLFYFSGHGIKDDRNNLYLGTRITCKHKGSLFTPSALPATAMTPKFYPVEEGYKIRLSKSRRDDPKLKYEREFQKRAEEGDGKFSIFVRRILSGRQQEWGISPAEAKEIEDRVLQPYREYQTKLAEYEKTLTDAVRNDYPFSDRERANQKEYQQHLKLRDEDIVAIHQRVKPSVIRRLIDRRNFIKWIGFGGTGVVMAFVLPQIFKGFDTPTQTPIKSSSPNQLPPQIKNYSLQNLSTIEFPSVKLNDKGAIIDQSKVQAKIYQEDLGNGISPRMVKIPAGEFMMGSPASEKGRFNNESPQHKVNVPEFYMGQTLVTQAQWQQLMGNNPSHFTGDGKLPVEQISWLDTQEFCQKLSQHSQRAYRLPSEAEWEYACRAGTKTPFAFGETITGKFANYNSDYNSDSIYRQEPKVKQRGKTTPGGEFPPNPFGLYDMHGNLWEWCLDRWHENYQDAPADGSAWLSDDDRAIRVLRGGSWHSYPRICRSASRFNFTPDNRSINIGFRVVCEIPRT
jgi:formylglycine-generating enzyme required for sulfatase activity